VTDWSTVASLATAGGTLILAVSTFAAVRSANRSARVTERSLQAGIRPVLMASRMEDPTEKVGFSDDHWVKVPGGRGVAEVTDGVVYLAIALRNVGTGLAVLDRWDIHPRRMLSDEEGGSRPRDPSLYRRLTRDLYVPAGDTGFWQGALRDPAEPIYGEVQAAIEADETITIDLLYGDHEGGQRMVTRISLLPHRPGEPRLCATSRHWNLDRDDPR
jgi:hypothetical protein